MTRAQTEMTDDSLSLTYRLERDYRLNIFKKSNDRLIPSRPPKISSFKVSYQGRPVVIKDRDGRKVTIWQAWFLQDAPKPAVLASSNYVYLITAGNRADAGQAHVTVVANNWGALNIYQWLDGDHGQPGRAQFSFPADSSRASRLLTGGRYLLVNECSVLDVHKLTVHPFDLISKAALKRTDGFVRVGSILVGFSPGQTQPVFLGTRYNHQRQRSEYALLAVDFVNNQTYAVPFRPSATQFILAEDATSDWLTTYFDWTTDSQGREVLSVHPYTQPPPWHGRWAQNPGKIPPIRYELKPVLPGMFDHFMSWAKKHYPTIEPKITRYEDMVSAKFTLNGSVLNLYVRDDYKSLSLESTDQTLLKIIGDQFDGELRQGRFQDAFAEMDPD
ncbi:MAG: hypothetical protein ABIO93_21610 [Dyadobacter sp.]|uniref:hypothetical protein n=1 Tax=Dyadobacter sp. TaxID=1914288 RepID=UPI003263EDF5